MKLKKIMLLFVVAIGLMTLMSTECESEEPIPECNGIITATTTGEIEQTFCFDNLNSYTYEPTNYISLWAWESTTDIGFDIKITAVNEQAITPGTYNCGSGEPGFVEFIIEDQNNPDSDFYKSKSGTITLTEASGTNFSATFNVVVEGYYNGKSMTFSGTVNK